MADKVQIDSLDFLFANDQKHVTKGPNALTASGVSPGLILDPSILIHTVQVILRKI